ncbi:MAG: hypothetical protein WEB63_09450 [Cucumibacter sp.]
MSFASYIFSLLFRVALLFGGGAMAAYGATGLRLFADALGGKEGAAEMGFALIGTGVLGLLVACAGLALGFIASVGLLRRVQAGPFWMRGRPTEFGEKLIFEGEMRARVAGVAVGRKFGKRSD